MPRHIIDLSIAIEPGLPSDPEMMIPQIDYVDHEAGAVQMEAFFPGLKKAQLPEGLGWAIEMVRLTTHSGTHLDAPHHYHPFMDKGRKALTIDEVPLEWCFSDGVRLDFSHKADGERITADDVERELDRIGYALKPLDIVLVRTGADAFWGRPEYLVKGAGMTRESTLYLCERGVKVVGIDAWSWDRPLPFLAKEFQETGDPGVIWEAHFAGIERGYCHMEKLANLDKIPVSWGFKVACFPIKIKAASAGWVRPVAIMEDAA
ncbi:MAG: cyclase family protein [Deltaproteobacteria bacterium]|jgi:kynurenine formamidase